MENRPTAEQLEAYQRLKAKGDIAQDCTFYVLKHDIRIVSENTMISIHDSGLVTYHVSN
jgi:hypothetical protein